jgi:predicted transcriptional regulator
MLIKEAIKEKGIKKSWLASKLGISKTLMSFYLNGDRPIPVNVEEKLKELLS